MGVELDFFQTKRENLFRIEAKEGPMELRRGKSRDKASGGKNKRDGKSMGMLPRGRRPITSVLNSTSSRLLVSILFSSLSFVLFCSSFWLSPCVHFHVLGRAMSPRLGRVA